MKSKKRKTEPNSPYAGLPSHAELPWEADGNWIYGYTEPDPLADHNSKHADAQDRIPLLWSQSPQVVQFVAREINDRALERANRRKPIDPVDGSIVIKIRFE
jgi:hypothetical protein